jgi:renalase
MHTESAQHIAVIGSGLAGSACAQVLVRAGHVVQVFDKARGPGGRLATRRMAWQDAQGQACMTRLDHGAVGLTAQSPAFQQFLSQAHEAGCLAEWAPRWATPPDSAETLWVPLPDLPALAQHLLRSMPATWSFAVDALHKDTHGWRLAAGSQWHEGVFDAVVLAIPPAQAAPLLGPHRSDWARSAALARMQPCWTLMGVADDPDDQLGAALGGDLAKPVAGPLAWVVRQDARPGRQRVAGQSHWVVHARAGWSRQHLETSADEVQAHLQAAFAELLGRPVHWLHSVAHRWRYALPQAAALGTTPAGDCWWDAVQGLGVCGDFLGTGGAEGAWLSAQALCAAMLQPTLNPPTGDAACGAKALSPHQAA